jgi:hypothetical protein
MPHARPSVPSCSRPASGSALVLALAGLAFGCGYEVFDGLSTDEDSIADALDGGSDGGDTGEDTRDGGGCEGDACIAPSCRNMEQDGSESAIDCGGTGSCPRCAPGLTCSSPRDCESGVCDASGHCAEPSCSDDVQNGAETATDCGGNGSCDRCAVGASCKVGSDCTEQVCSAALACLAPTCSDGAHNGNEKGADCGGACAPDKRCAAGTPCDRADECEVPYCLLSACRMPLGGSAHVLPGTLEAEDYDEGPQGFAYSDSTAANTSMTPPAREGGVDLESTSDLGGGLHVTATEPGEWLTFTVSVAEAADYTLELRTAARDRQGMVSFEVDGEAVATNVVAPRTFGAQRFTTVERNNVRLPAGEHLLRVLLGNAGVNLNWIRVSQTGSPYGGTPWPVPGTIEAEDFDVGGENVGYRSPGGEPTVDYRATGVRLQPCTDTGGGFNVMDTQGGDWLAYTIDVPATASYRFAARVASTLADQTLSLEVDDVAVAGSIAVPNTGNFQLFTDVSSGSFELTKGVRTIKLKFNNGFVNVNWIRLTAD